MTQYEELTERINSLTTRVDALAYPMKWNYMDENMPEWAVESVQAAMDNEIIDPEGNWDLDYDNLRALTWMHRCGAF